MSRKASSTPRCPIVQQSEKKEKKQTNLLASIRISYKKITLEICGNGICLGEIIPFREVTSCDTTCGRLVFAKLVVVLTPVSLRLYVTVVCFFLQFCMKNNR